MNSLRGILGAIRQADQKFDLFHEKDRIAIGVSGGKDSMVLAIALNQYRYFKCANFEIVPIILDLGFPGFDATPIVSYFAKQNMELHVINSKEVYPILKENKKENKHLPCSICSRMKKAAINKAAKDLGCNKVAFAHHIDDALETLMMNAIYGGRIATFQPKMHLERSDIEFIRPLILVHESQISMAQKEENIPVFSSHCPNDGYTMRSEMKDYLKEIYKKYPTTKKNFILMLENHKQEMLFHHDLFYKVERKDLSFKPVISAEDARVELKLRKELKMENFEEGLYRFIIYKLDKPIGFALLKENGEKTVRIIELKLKRFSKANYSSLFDFVENNITRHYYGARIEVEKFDYEEYLLSKGYKKIRECGFVKQFKGD